jgi:hypothetical protein
VSAVACTNTSLAVTLNTKKSGGATDVYTDGCQAVWISSSRIKSQSEDTTQQNEIMEDVD